MIRLIASDLDGTIIDNNNKICQKNLEAINFINSQNIPFVICTGKTYLVCKEICSKLNATYGIFGNGSSIIDLKTGKILYENLLDKNDVIKIIKLAKRSNLHVHIYSNKQIITERLLYLDLRNFELQKNNKSQLEFKIVSDLLEYVESHNLKVSNIVISSEEKLDLFKKCLFANFNFNILHINKSGKYKDFIINKEYEYLNIFNNNVNKSHALKILAKHLKINEDEILAIGDNLNDIEMIKNSGIGVAVNNAYDELKNMANFVTESSAQYGGFAEAIFKFLKTE